MPIETQVEWIQRHGGSPELSEDERLWLFPDGAAMNSSEIEVCRFRHEPPNDDRARLEIQKAYWTARVQRIARQMAGIKAALNGAPFLNWDHKIPKPQGVSGPVAVLEYLRDLAAEPKERLAAVEAELAKLPVNQVLSIRERRLKRALAKRANQARDQLQKAMAVTI